MREEIHKSAYLHQRSIESGDLEVVGVNTYQDEEESLIPEAPDFISLARKQRGRLETVRSTRDEASVAGALDEIQQVASRDGNLLPVLVDAVQKRVTLGEISHTLRRVWGEYQPQ